MKYSVLLFGLVLVGCSGESAPVVGDNPITKGIQRRAPVERKPSAAAATSSRPRRVSPQEYAKMRAGQ